MEKAIVIKAGSVEVKGVLKNTSLAEKIYKALPFNSRARTWGKEIYFEIPVDSAIDEPVEEVEKGDIAYWP
ncbi:MAG TPA: cyclophilin-like fold protein, partial [bacterium]|nr:cyclophilin-like fold protein [bacterium]